MFAVGCIHGPISYHAMVENRSSYTIFVYAMDERDGRTIGDRAIFEGVEIKQGATGTIETKERHVYIRAKTMKIQWLGDVGGTFPETIGECVKTIDRNKKTIVQTTDF